MQRLIACKILNMFNSNVRIQILFGLGIDVLAELALSISEAHALVAVYQKEISSDLRNSFIGFLTYIRNLQTAALNMKPLTVQSASARLALQEIR